MTHFRRAVPCISAPAKKKKSARAADDALALALGNEELAGKRDTFVPFGATARSMLSVGSMADSVGGYESPGNRNVQCSVFWHVSGVRSR